MRQLHLIETIECCGLSSFLKMFDNVNLDIFRPFVNSFESTTNSYLLVRRIDHPAPTVPVKKINPQLHARGQQNLLLSKTKTCATSFYHDRIPAAKPVPLAFITVG